MGRMDSSTSLSPFEGLVLFVKLFKPFIYYLIKNSQMCTQLTATRPTGLPDVVSGNPCLDRATCKDWANREKASAWQGCKGQF